MMRWLTGAVAVVAICLASPAFANQFVAYFDYGGVIMSEGGYATARRVVGYSRNDPDTPSRVLIVAHMDTAEIHEFSEELALRRAQAMATELVQYGVDPAVIEMRSDGARALARPTADHVREPLNRRVQVEVYF